MKKLTLAAEILRTAAAGSLFLVLARTLSVSDFGVVATVTAWIAIAGPIAALGSPYQILHGDGSLINALILARRMLLTCVFVTGPVVLAVVTAAIGLSAGFGVGVVLLLCFGELVMVLYGLLLTSVAVRHQDGRLLLRTSLLGVLPRTFATVAATWIGEPALAVYASVLAGAALGLVLVEAVRKGSRAPSLLALQRWRESSGYGGSSLLSRLSDDADKIVLSALAPVAVGLYTVPYRLAFYLMIPGRALLVARMGSWYKLRGNGVKMDVLATAGLGAAAAGVGTVVLALSWEVLNRAVLDGKYDVPTVLFYLLGAAVCFRLVHYALGELLFARGRLRARTFGQGLALTSSLILLITLVPRDPLIGASIATLVGEVVAVFAFGGLLLQRRKRPRVGGVPSGGTAARSQGIGDA